MNETLRFKINGKEAWEQYHAYLSEGALAELLTPPPMKSCPVNESRYENGKRIVSSVARFASRDLTLPIYLSAESTEQFFMYYQRLCAMLSAGKVNIRTRFFPALEYKCLYLSCQQVSQWNGTLAKIVLKLVEPDPTDREPIAYPE